MLKLMKYEFRKWRTALLALLGGLVALEIGFIVGLKLDKMGVMGICLGCIAMLTFAAFVCVMLAGIATYSQELSQKSGYMTFMTPVPTLGVVVARLLYIALVSIAAMALFGAAAYFDVRILIGRANLDQDTLNQINLLLRFGLKANASVQQILLMAAYFAGMALIELMTTLCTAYLAITLSATLMQNKKGFLRFLVSGLLFVALTWGTGWITQRLFYDSINGASATFEQVRGILGWASLLNLAFCALFTWASAWLLEHKVNL